MRLRWVRSAQFNTVLLLCVLVVTVFIFKIKLSSSGSPVNRRASSTLLSSAANPKKSFFDLQWPDKNVSYNYNYNYNNDKNITALGEKTVKERDVLYVAPGETNIQSSNDKYFHGTFRELLKHRYDEMPPNLGADNRQEKDKYFIYRCDGNRMQGCGGWSDRIKGFLVGYIIANLTGRTFKAEIKTGGCDLHDYIVPNLVNWSLPVSFHQPVKVDGDEVYIMNQVNKKTFFNTIKNIDFRTHPMNKFKYVYFKANLDYADGLRENIFHHDQLSWMEGLSRDQIQGAIYRRLIKLSPRLQRRLDEFLAINLPKPSDKLICAHIRMGRNPTIPNDSVKYNSFETLPKIWEFIGNFTKQEGNKIFLMSDSEPVMEEARRQPFGENLLEIPGKILHVERSRGVAKGEMCTAQEKLVLEHFVLMHCDVLMISKSGLSRLPAYIRGSNEGLFCLVNESVIPCQLDQVKELFKISG